MSEFRHEVIVRPAFDRRHAEPSKNYGIHGCDLVFYLHGEKGVIQFLLSTNWHLPHVREELDARTDRQFPHLSCHPLPADIGYHSPVPRYEGHDAIDDACTILDGKPCYYDGSSLMAEDVFRVLVAQGTDGLWAEMERRYTATFGEDGS